MLEQWQSRLALFDDVPIVDFFGIVANQGMGGWGAIEGKYPYQPKDIGHTRFEFDVWRIESGEVQTTRLYMTAIIGYQEWNSLGHRGFSSSSIVHLKAKVARNEAGFYQALFVELVGPITDDAELNELRRQLVEPVILDAPPLPALRMSNYDGSWNGMIVLRSWDGFYLQSNPGYGAGRGDRCSLRIDSAPLPEVRLGYRGVAPSPEQVAAYIYLMENEKAVQDAVLQSLLEHYPQWQEEYGGDDEFMPNVTSRKQFKSLLLLWMVTIKHEAKEGYAYVYLEILPNWDIEHGLGVVLHKDRVVAIGDQDSVWDAVEQDREAS